MKCGRRGMKNKGLNFDGRDDGCYLFWDNDVGLGSGFVRH